MRGHLRDLNKMIPFSTDKLSLGRPATDHILMVTSSPKTYFIDMFGVNFSLSLLRACLHSSSSSDL
jgi:hypothetical protein